MHPVLDFLLREKLSINIVRAGRTYCANNRTAAGLPSNPKSPVLKDSIENNARCPFR